MVGCSVVYVFLDDYGSYTCHVDEIVKRLGATEAVPIGSLIYW